MRTSSSTDLATVRAWLGRVCYKDWRFKSHVAADPERLRVGLFRKVIDSSDGVTPIEVAVAHVVPQYALEDFVSFCEWLLDMIELFERHEMLEWFRVDGKMWRNPHVSAG